MKSGTRKGVLKISIVLLFCLMLCMSLFGCVRPLKTKDEFFEEGYFSFVKVNKDSKAIEDSDVRSYFDKKQAIMLLDLTEEGKEQTVIDVPETVNGLPVISISPKYRTTLGHTYMFDDNYGRFSSDKLEKIYINGSVREFGISAWSPVKCKNLSRIIINNQLAPLEESFVITSPELIVAINQNCSDDILYGLIRFPHEVHEYTFIHTANIEYKYNYDTGTAQENYRIDLIKDKTETPYEFADPYREGYTFGGWYLEPECINEWYRSIDSLLDEESGDIEFYTERNIFDDMPTTELPKKEEYKNYINKTDKILRLYAKWIED